MLLWTNNHTWTHEAHKSNDFVCCESMSVNEICSNEASCPAKSGFAVNTNCLFLDSNHVVSKSDKLANHWKSRASAIIKDHVQMLDSIDCEECRRVKWIIKSYNQTNISFAKV